MVLGNDVGKFADLLCTTRDVGQGSRDVTFCCAQGETLSLQVRCRMIRRQGQTCVLAVLRDVAERREIESSLREAQREVAHASEFKSGLLRNVTHEMRTPLNHILGFAELLHDERLNESQQTFVQNIHQAGKELRGLVNSILDVSRIEAGNLQLEVLSCSLRALIHELETIGQTRAQEKNLAFEVHCDPALPETFRTDVDRLRQCLMTLIDNAVKFTDQGQVELRVAPACIDDCHGVEFSVHDTGPGIAEDLQEIIFHPFAQGDTSVTRTQGGLGTGLTIAARLAELLGGRITLESKLGEGSTFTIVIPCTNTQSAVEC